MIQPETLAGTANLLIGRWKKSGQANLPMGRFQDANQEIGGPRILPHDGRQVETKKDRGGSGQIFRETVYFCAVGMKFGTTSASII
jgi:hypothetical protein